MLVVRLSVAHGGVMVPCLLQLLLVFARGVLGPEAVVVWSVNASVSAVVWVALRAVPLDASPLQLVEALVMNEMLPSWWAIPAAAEG